MADIIELDSGRRTVAAARELTPWEKRRTARTAAHHATDAADLAELLDMLGLTAHDGKAKP